MSSGFNISNLFFESVPAVGEDWLCKTTDWAKLLQLPNVTWLQFLVATVCLIMLILAILRLVARVNEDVDPAETDREMLQALHDLRRQGDLTDDEFRSIKGQIVGSLNMNFQAAGTTRSSAKIAKKVLVENQNTPNETEVCDEAPETQNLRPEAVDSDQPETFTSSTNVPTSLQDTSNLAERMIAPKSETGEGKTDGGPDEKEHQNFAPTD